MSLAKLCGSPALLYDPGPGTATLPVSKVLLAHRSGNAIQALALEGTGLFDSAIVAHQAFFPMRD